MTQSQDPKVQAFINPKSGSIRITGLVDIVDAEGNVLKSIENPKFCGCGLSSDKPFCDGSHKYKSNK
jgi:CDGSH-type Zn-finger protein